MDEDFSKNVYEVGHHIGLHLTSQVKCISFELQENELITGITIWNENLIDRIEFQTDYLRIFEAGKPKD